LAAELQQPAAPRPVLWELLSCLVAPFAALLEALRLVAFLRQQSGQERLWEVCFPHSGSTALDSAMGSPEFAWCM
jgi:hypothetical protein